MTRFVVDASVALRWFLDVPIPPYAARVRKMLEDGDRAVVPAIWHLEMANTLLISTRRGKITQNDADTLLFNIESLLHGSIETRIEGISVRRAMAVARAWSLTAYDASYLELAQTEKLRLSTLDVQLRNAAVRAGVELVP
nr:type II toxin-antitoxin system VapC family toxin [Candidatus Acidoferrales bacterium]